MGDLNKKFILFLETVELKKSKEYNVDAWIKYNAEKQKKPRKKNAYFIFLKERRTSFVEENEHLISNKEILGALSEEWKLIKSQNTDEYMRFVQTAIEMSPVDTNEKVYEISKPFHKFSVEFRTGACEDNPEMTNVEITQVLVDKWNGLTRKEKQEWVL
jgi:hypothetical protein